MKRILLFTALLFLASARVLFAQTGSGNHVLVEEFKSTNCPPCAGTDPAIDLFEQENLGSICVLKWHQNFPEPNEDPFYTAETSSRFSYYGLSGAPSLMMQGMNNLYSVSFWLSAPLGDSASAYLNQMGDYYQMSVKHSVVGDSVIVWVTVTTAATLPTATDLNLGVVVAERYHQWRGANGRPDYSDIALKAIPPLASNGAINNPFTQAPSTTVTYRYATKVVSSWDLSELMAVSFIQSIGTAGTTPKQVFQSAWDVPNITLLPDGAATYGPSPMPLLAGDASSSGHYLITNNLDSTTTVKVSASLTVPSNYTLNVTGLNNEQDSSITLPAGGSATLTVSVASNGPALTAPEYYLRFRTVDSIGIGGGGEVAFGKDIPITIVNTWTEATKAILDADQTTFANTGYGATAQICSESFEQLFGLYGANDWSQFKTVIYDDDENWGVNDLDDTSLITGFLNNGGNLAVICPLLPYWLSAQLPQYGYQGTDAFLQNVFHIEDLQTTNGGFSSVTGVPGDPIGSKLSGRITVAAASTTQTVYPIDDSAHGVFVDPAGDTIATRATSNGGKVYYSSVELASVNASKRDAMTKAIMDWFYGTSAGVNDPATAGCMLDAAYPNPLSDAATSTIGYTITDHRFVTLVVRDMMGRSVASLVNQEEDAGHYTAPFDASDLADGTYIYTLTAGDFKATGKMTVAR